ncbi:MAG: FtsX-like permease family protein, partial [Pseudomonadales bacterium]|nr:FtsX-like permease family protein [Pseudomonadales bacterium]
MKQSNSTSGALWQFDIGLRYFLSVYKITLTGLISRIALASLVIAVSMLILVMSVMNGFEKELRNRILAFIPHISVELALEGDEQGNTRSKAASFAMELMRTPGVSAVYRYSREEVLLNNGYLSSPVLLVGLDQEMVEKTPVFLSLFTRQQWADFFSGTGAILVSNRLAHYFQLSEGDAVLALRPTASSSQSALSTKILNYTYLGDFSTGTELDKGMAFKKLETDVPEGPHIFSFRLEVEDVYQASVLADKLQQRYRDARITTWMDSQGGLYEAIRLSRNLVVLLLLLIIVVAVFNVVTTLMLMVKEKHSSIAILKTMGARKSDLMFIFLIQGGGIGFSGTFLGVLTGALLASIISPLVERVEVFLGFKFLDVSVYPIDFLPSDLHITDVLLIASVSVLLSLFGALYPAWVASRIAPAKILK